MSTPLTDTAALEIADLLERAAAEVRARVRTSAMSVADLAHRSAHGDDMDTLLDPSALAALLLIDVRTLRRLRAAGEIPPPIMLGRKPRWRPHDIEAWLAERSAT